MDAQDVEDRVCEGRGRFANRPYAGRGVNRDRQDVSGLGGGLLRYVDFYCACGFVVGCGEGLWDLL